MALIQGSASDIASAMSRESLVTLDGTGLYFSPPQAVPGTDPTLTKVRVTALGTYQYRGSEVITLHRLNLADLPGKFIAPPIVNYASTLYGILTAMANATGILLTTDDVVDAPVTDNDDGTFSVVIAAKPTSLGWIGSCTFVFGDLPPLSLAVTTTSIGWK